MRIRESSTKARICRTSEFLHLEAYTADGLVISHADGDQAMIGRVYEASPLVAGGGEFANVVVNLFKTAPDGATISVSHLCAPDHDAPECFLIGKRHGNATLQLMLQRHAKLMTDSLSAGWQPDVPLLSRRRVFITLAVPAKALAHEVLERARATQRDFLSQLHAVGFADAHALSPEGLVELFRLLGDPLQRPVPAELDPTAELRDQLYGPDDEFDFTARETGRLGKTHVAGVGIKWYPAEVSQATMNLAIGAPFNQGAAREGGGERIPTAHLITTTLRVADQRRENDRIEKAISSRLNARPLPFRLGFEDTPAVLKDLQILEQRCMTGESEKYVFASTNLFVFAATREQALEARGISRGHWSRLGFDAREIGPSLLPRYAQSLPLNFSTAIAEKLACETLMPSGAAACLMPLYGDSSGNGVQGEAAGVPFVTRRGTPYWLDVFRTPGAFNGVVAAASGAGKTVAAQWIMTCNVAQGATVVAFDNGRSMLKMAAALGGEFIDFQTDALHRPSLNPFTGLDDQTFEEERQGIVSLLLLMAYGPGEEIEDGARIAVDEAVVAAYGQRQDKAELAGVVNALQQIVSAGAMVTQRSQVMLAAVNLVARLKSFLDSPSRGGFFRGPATLNMDAPMTVFDVFGLEGDPHLKQVVTFFAVNHTMSRLARRPSGVPALLIFDEAADHLKDPRTAAALEGLYRKGRKSRVGTWIITQSLMDLSEARSGSVGQIVLSQSYWKIVMRQDAADVLAAEKDGLLETYTNDPFFAKMVRDVTSVKGRYSELLIMAGRSYETVRLYVPRLNAAMYSSEGAERDTVLKLMREGRSALEAVSMVIGDSEDRSVKRRQWVREFVRHFRSSEQTVNDHELVALMEEELARHREVAHD